MERLHEMGDWLNKYGFSIYETRGGPFKPTDWGVSTRKENKIYLHLLNLPGNSTKILLPDIGKEIIKCSLVGGKALKFRKQNNEIVIEVGNSLPKAINNILEIEFAESIMDVVPLEVRPLSLSFKKQVTGSSNMEPQWSDHQWIDIRSVTNGDWTGDFWHPAETDVKPSVDIDIASVQPVKTAILYERDHHIKAFELQYKSGEKWITLYKGKTIGERAEVSFPETKLQYFRLVILEQDGVPGIYEIVLL
jgi:alpha-L-fucosidase